MPDRTAAIGKGGQITAESEHRAGDGTLISRQVTLPLPHYPDPPEHPDPNCEDCIKQYIRNFKAWTERCNELNQERKKIGEYHAKRVAFAEKHRRSNIPEKYRTGEPSPTNGLEAESEIKQLKVLEKEVKNVPRASSKQ
jgi:hypothetical protein